MRSFMKTRIVLVLLISIVPTQFCFGQDIVAMVKRVKPAVVTIIPKNAFGFEEGQGSGFFISQNRVITCYHVIDGASMVSIRLNDSTTINAKHIVAQDSAADVAIIELESPAPARVIPLKMLNKQPEQGERIYVVGNPLGLEQSVSDGIVSSVRVQKEQGKVIQFTAAISPGNSGSPLLDATGAVYGVARSVLEGGQNLNFACPTERIPAPLDVGAISFVATTKSYLGEEMAVKDAFVVDTTLEGVPPKGMMLIDQNLWKLRVAARRLGWQPDVVDKNMSRLSRAVKRKYEDLNITTDTLSMKRAYSVALESLGSNEQHLGLAGGMLGNFSEAFEGLQQGLEYAFSRYSPLTSASPMMSIGTLIETTHQLWTELEKDQQYAVLTISNDRMIEDMDMVVFYRDSTNTWIPIASDTQSDALPSESFTAPVTGEYAIIWRVARFVDDNEIGAFVAIVIEY
jgi:hypothetical protein